MDSITVDRNPDSDNEQANKMHIDNSIGEGKIVRFKKTLQNYFQVSVGNDVYVLVNNIKI